VEVIITNIPVNVTIIIIIMITA